MKYDESFNTTDCSRCTDMGYSLTGNGISTVLVSTGVPLLVSFLPLSMPTILPEECQDTVKIFQADKTASSLTEYSHPPFVGELGTERSHRERAFQFKRAYQPVVEDPAVGDVPEDLL